MFAAMSPSSEPPAPTPAELQLGSDATALEPPPLAAGILVHLVAATAVLAPLGPPSPIEAALRAVVPMAGLVALRALQRSRRIADDRWGAVELLYLGWVLLGVPWLVLRGLSGVLSG